MFVFNNVFHKNPNYNFFIFILSLGLLYFIVFGMGSSKEGFLGSKFIRNRKNNLKSFFSKLQRMNTRMHKYTDVKYRKMIRRLK